MSTVARLAAAPTPRQLKGRAAEERALQHLLGHGLVLLTRNYRLALGPSARAGEIDLIVRAGDGTVVFVEVRARASARHGGAAASVGPSKQARLRRTAAHYLLRWPDLPPCRFDVVALDGDQLEWLQGVM